MLSKWVLIGLPNLILVLALDPIQPGFPVVINTWGGPFTVATDAAFAALKSNASTPLDAVQIGCTACEANQCDGSVGYGGSPDESCETTLDALIMDGNTFNSGAVAGLRGIRNAIGVARNVMDNTKHSLLAGDLASDFAVEMGFERDGDLSTPESRKVCEEWKQARCQPNYRLNVSPDAEASCGPYTPVQHPLRSPPSHQTSHDTISLLALTRCGALAAGTSTNGARHKVPGRVGDGPIVGSGSYADAQAGACGATGDGDVMMRFLPCYQAVENLRQGMDPVQAAEDAVKRMAERMPGVNAGLVVLDMQGRIGAASAGWDGFTFAYRGGDMDETVVVNVKPVDAEEEL